MGLEPREVHPDAHVRPAREGEVAGGVGALEVEAVGVREDGGVAVRGGDRDRARGRRAGSRRRRADVARSRSDRARPPRARGAATPRRRRRAAGARPRGARAGRGSRADAGPRWRSSPRSSRCRRTSARRRSTRPPRARARRRPARRRRRGSRRVALERRPERVAQRRERRLPALAERPALGELVDGLDDPVVPAEHRSGSVPRRPSACITTAAASGPAKLRRSSARPAGSIASISASVSSATRALKRSRTASSRNGRAKAARWRRCSSPSSVSMLGPTTRPVENRGSSTVNVAASFITSIARSRRVTSQPSSTSTHATGSRSRSSASSAYGLVEVLERRRRVDGSCRAGRGLAHDAADAAALRA